MRESFPFFFHIRTKLIISYAAIIIFTILIISIVFFTAAKQIISQHVRDLDQFLAEQLSANLSSQLKSLEELQFSQYSYSLLGDLLINVPVNYTDLLNQNRRISECLTRLCYSKNFIEGAIVIDNNGNRYSQNISNDYDIANDAFIADRNELTKKFGKVIWTIDTKGRLLMHRLLVNINSTRAVGQITIAINPQYLTGIYENEMAGTRGNILIFDKSGNFIPTMDAEINNMAVELFEMKELKGNAELTINRKQYIVSRAFFSDNSYEMFHILPVSELGIYAKTLLLFTSLAALVAIIATILVAHIISRQVTGGINSLITGIRRFAGGNLRSPVQVKSTDEIGYLAVEFNRMADSINNLIENIYNVELKKSKAETDALQFEYSALESKINPHFLYNTLESVNSLAKIRGADDISEIVCLLGNLLRDNIS
ncbi:MAG: histidine kinase, partial [Treponema sp.]|nr:histidine kinase [Treponema sp.]